MLQPTRTKYRKAFKGRIKGKASRAVTLNYGQFGLKAMQPERVIGKQTNNVAELSAIIEVFTILKEEIESGKKIIIYSDSKISIGWCTTTGCKYEKMNWVKKNGIPNVELIKIGYGLCKNNTNVSLEHIRAHTGLSDE